MDMVRKDSFYNFLKTVLTLIRIALSLLSQVPDIVHISSKSRISPVVDPLE
jgi:hypothetical protein